MEKVEIPKVSGKWKNELGSVMELVEDNSGKISGTYTTAVEFFKTSNTEESAKVLGYTNVFLKEQSKTLTITFCMAWKNEGSCSAFTGQVFKDSKGDDVMKTTWLLHSPMPGLQDNWEATRVGENTFYRL